MSSVILLTDFGVNDYYAGVLHLVLRRKYPTLTVTDLCHGIAPGNILSASWTLASAVPYAEKGCVFCAVVDPGVGTKRHITVAHWPDFTVVAPDNGLLSLCARRYGRPETRLFSAEQICALLDLPVPSATFHGRDLLAPLAGFLACGGALPSPAHPDEPVWLPVAEPRPHVAQKNLLLAVLHQDHFGNLILDYHQDEYPETAGHLSGTVLCGPGWECRNGVRTFADVPRGEPLFYWGSSGWLELAVNGGSAAALFEGKQEPLRLILP